MSVWQRLAASQDLWKGMARRLGITLPDRTLREARGIAMRCAACKSRMDCARLQSESEALADAPGYCPNRDFFKTLQRQ